MSPYSPPLPTAAILPGLGDAGLADFGTTAGTAAEGNDARIVGALPRLTQLPVSTATTGTLAASTLSLVDCTSTPCARTLPAASSVAAGITVGVHRTGAGSNALTVSRAGSDTLASAGSVTDTTRALTLAGETVVFQSDGVDQWAVVASDVAGEVMDGRYAPVTSVKQYGAVGDGRQIEDAAITSGAAILTSPSGGTSWPGFTSSDVGKTVYIDGAGAAGASFVTTISGYTSATQVTLTANAGTTVTGRTAVFGSDDTASIQAAIDAAPSGGLDLFFPDGIYVVGGAQVTGTVQGIGAVSAYSWTYSGQILFPARGIVDGKKTFRLSGRIPSARMQWGASNEPSPVSGSILFSTAASGNIFDVIPNPSGMNYDISSPYSSIYVAMDCLTVRAMNNPQCNGLKFLAAGSVDIDRCSVDVAAIPTRIAQPTGGTTGVIMPVIGNAAACHLDRMQSVGFAVGIEPGEHTIIGNGSMVQYCITGVKVQQSSHAIEFEMLLIQDCVTGIEGGAGTAPVTGTFDIQESRDGSWYDTVYAISDTNNRLRGSLKFVNSNSTGIPVLGGTNLNLMNAKGGTGWYKSSPLAETFARDTTTGNRSYTLGTASGSAHPWRDVSGFSAFGTTGNKAYAPSSSPASSIAVAQLCNESYTIRCSITTSTQYTAAGVVTWFLPTRTDTYFYAELRILTGAPTNSIRLIKSDQGVKTTAAQLDSTLVANTTYIVELVCTPYSIALYVDGTQIGSTYVLSAAERTKFSVNPSAGLWCYRAGSGSGDDGVTRWNSITAR